MNSLFRAQGIGIRNPAFVRPCRLRIRCSAIRKIENSLLLPQEQGIWLLHAPETTDQSGAHTSSDITVQSGFWDRAPELAQFCGCAASWPLRLPFSRDANGLKIPPISRESLRPFPQRRYRGRPRLRGFALRGVWGSSYLHSRRQGCFRFSISRDRAAVPILSGRGELQTAPHDRQAVGQTRFGEMRAPSSQRVLEGEDTASGSIARVEIELPDAGRWNHSC